MQPPLAPCGSAIQRFPLIPYLRATGYQPPDLAPIYSARSVRSSSLSLNLKGSSSVPMMMSGPAPTLAATADFGRMSSQLSASTRTLTPVFSVDVVLLTKKLSNSAWMNCFQRKTRIEAPASGAGPFQAGSARATPCMRSNPAAPPDCKTRRLVMSTISSSLGGATKRFFRSTLHRAATGRQGVARSAFRALRFGACAWRRIGADEAVAVRHLDLGERICVEGCFLRDDPVEEQHIGRNGVDFVGREGLRRVERHGASNKVEQCRRVGPETADGLFRLLVAQRADAANEAIHRLALAMGAVTTRAFRREDRLALPDVAVSRRQPGAAGRGVDVPALDLLRRRRTPNVVALGGRNGAGHNHRGDCESHASNSIRHWSLRRWPQRSSSELRCSDNRIAHRALSGAPHGLAARSQSRQ